MNPRRHPLLREALAILRSSGCTNITHHQNKHAKIRATLANGRPFTLVMAVSPSDRRAEVKNRTLLRRLLRSADATLTNPTTTEER